MCTKKYYNVLQAHVYMNISHPLLDEHLCIVTEHVLGPVTVHYREYYSHQPDC